MPWKCLCPGQVKSTKLMTQTETIFLTGIKKKGRMKVVNLMI